MEFPVLQNDKIILEQLTHEYINEAYDHFSNDIVNENVDFDSVQNIEETKELIRFTLGNVSNKRNKDDYKS